jgi:hypothetical protein
LTASRALQQAPGVDVVADVNVLAAWGAAAPLGGIVLTTCR